MEKTLIKDVALKQSENKVALVKHIMKNFDSYIVSGSITLQECISNPDYDSSKHYSWEKIKKKPQVVITYEKFDDTFWQEALKHKDNIEKQFKSKVDWVYKYTIHPVYSHMGERHDYTLDMEHKNALVEMIKCELADRIASNLHDCWNDYTHYIRVKNVIEKYRETPIVEQRRDHKWNTEFNGVLGKNEVVCEDDSDYGTANEHNITLNYSGYNTEGMNVSLTFRLREPNHDGLLYMKKGAITYRYSMDKEFQMDYSGSNYPCQKNLLSYGELTKKMVDGMYRDVNYKLDSSWGEATRKVNFSTYILDARRYVKNTNARYQSNQKAKVLLRDSISQLQEEFPKCEVYTTGKMDMTYGVNGYVWKRYGDCNLIVKFPNGSKIAYDVCDACQGSLTFRGAFDNEYVKAEYNEEHFIKLFQKQNDDS